MASGYTYRHIWLLTVAVFSLDINLVCSSNDLFSNQSFVSIWNAPTAICDKHGITLNLSNFDIIANTNDTFEGNDIVIFYKQHLGLYPWITDDGQNINGGLPQLSNVTKHLQQVERDITGYIPDRNFSGLAVIDWEEWRPIFDRNQYNPKQQRYVRASISEVRKKHPDWSEEQLENEARFEFEKAAKTIMLSTLDLCKRLRPSGSWGFYGFPDCYNNKVGETHCSYKTKSLNDRLDWLFSSSTVLLPSIYLREDFGTHENRHDRVYGTLEETSRVKQKYGGVYVPVVPYTRFRYGDTNELYDLIDLNNTIGQIAEAGLSGMALWDSSFSIRSASDCWILQTYLDSLLGQFVRNITNDMKQCSQLQCSSHGRCFKDFKSADTITKISDWFDFMMIFINAFRQTFDGSTIRYMIDAFYTPHHQCNCFKGWSGEKCDKPNKLTS